jgi:hypothetical protein
LLSPDRLFSQLDLLKTSYSLPHTDFYQHFELCCEEVTSPTEFLDVSMRGVVWRGEGLVLVVVVKHTAQNVWHFEVLNAVDSRLSW